ncbi:Quinone oxidoreductase-like protein 2-like protein [Diplonema papillatum]|nr:Quinone oxidoreductase-like protein 2-like protein [Diplonema papillatum]|eukprot:gene18229-28088_t
MTYRALACTEIKPTAKEGIAAVQVIERERAPLKAGQVRVAVKSAGLNFPELLMLQNKYQYKPKPPFVLCTEAAGLVVESKDASWKPGDRVLFSSWGTCSEEWVGKGSALHRLPGPLSFSQGAGFLMGYATGYHALVTRGHLQKGEWLLVTGAGGGMGMAAVQLGKVLGAKVIAAASSDEKLAWCKKAGADHVVNYGRDGKNLKAEVARITGGKMCDVIYEPVGGDIFDNCVRCVAPTGYARLLVVGFASGRIPKLPVNMALIKGFDLVGVRMGGQFAFQRDLEKRTHAELLKLGEEGLLKPIVTAEYPLEKAKDALTLMDDRKVIGKCCITMNPNVSSKL